MKVKRSTPGRVFPNSLRSTALQRRNLANIGLLTGIVTIGVVALGLWVQMVLL